LPHARRGAYDADVTTAPSPWLFYFDFISPYAFLAWTQIRSIAQRNGRALEPVPILFAALLDAHGHKGPAEIPAKRRYLFKDIARKAHRLGILHVAPPPAHPFNPLLPLRLASLPLEPKTREAIIDALFYAAWTQRHAIDAAAAVASVLDKAGLDGPALVTAAQTVEAKARLRAATDAAIQRGVFGVPTIDADGELFWGTDSLEDLELFASGRAPAFSDAGFGDLPVAAIRKAVSRAGER
jgi:2-hydroxychromene-2-carboxylate isomerase